MYLPLVEGPVSAGVELTILPPLNLNPTAIIRHSEDNHGCRNCTNPGLQSLSSAIGNGVDQQAVQSAEPSTPQDENDGHDEASDVRSSRLSRFFPTWKTAKKDVKWAIFLTLTILTVYFAWQGARYVKWQVDAQFKEGCETDLVRLPRHSHRIVLIKLDSQSIIDSRV